MQRLRLAAQLGAGLTGALYVLDEPTIGLHPRDTGRLIDNLRSLVGIGSTVLVVEHDADTIRAADHLIDLGPGGGTHGGRVVAEGTPATGARDEELAHGHRAVSHAGPARAAARLQEHAAAHGARGERAQPRRTSTCRSRWSASPWWPASAARARARWCARCCLPALRKKLGLTAETGRRSLAASKVRSRWYAPSRWTSRPSGARRARCPRPSSASGTPSVACSRPRRRRRSRASTRRASRSTRPTAAAAPRATARASSPTR